MSGTKFWRIALTLAVFGMGMPSARAALFANQFVEFELPPQWACNLEGAEWVCQNTNEAAKRDAIIVLAAKLAGPQDSLDQYLNYLKAAKSYTSVQGRPVKSEPKYAKFSNLGGQQWVDALHLESEIPGFYTRYLATVKADIGVLVTYSINKGKYSQYFDTFENMVKTLKVFRKPGVGLNQGTASGAGLPAINVPSHVEGDAVFPGVSPGGGAEGPRRAPKHDNSLLLILLAVGAVGFFIWRKRQQQD